MPTQFAIGRDDALAGRPCSSSNGKYLDGWYSASRFEITTYGRIYLPNGPSYGIIGMIGGLSRDNVRQHLKTVKPGQFHVVKDNTGNEIREKELGTLTA